MREREETYMVYEKDLKIRIQLAPRGLLFAWRVSGPEAHRLATAVFFSGSAGTSRAQRGRMRGSQALLARLQLVGRVLSRPGQMAKTAKVQVTRIVQHNITGKVG